MQRSFQRFDQLFDVLVPASQSRAERNRCDDKPPFLLRFSGGREAEAQEMVDGAFEGIAGAFGFILNQAGDVVIESESSTHIMMLGREHHDVNPSRRNLDQNRAASTLPPENPRC